MCLVQLVVDGMFLKILMEMQEIEINEKREKENQKENRERKTESKIRKIERKIDEKRQTR